MKVNLSLELSDATKTLTAADVAEALEQVPPTAKLRITQHASDRGYSNWHTMTFSWTEER